MGGAYNRDSRPSTLFVFSKPKGYEMTRTYLKGYVPASWFHPIGILKVLKRIWDRLPNVAGCLFVTYTIDREAMRVNGQGPSEAFDITRDRIRRTFHRLREGVMWDGRFYQIKSAYCTKVEFHNDEEGWPHFHCIWLTRQFVPHSLIAHLWTYGRVNVKRIQNEDFHYLLKYVCKDGDVPEWVLNRNRLRIFQPSKGFLKKSEQNRPKKKEKPTKKRRSVTTIAERLKKWERTATIITETADEPYREVRQITLHKPFREIFDQLVYAVALAGRYLGDGKIKITRQRDLYPWIENLMHPPPLPD